MVPKKAVIAKQLARFPECLPGQQSTNPDFAGRVTAMVNDRSCFLSNADCLPGRFVSLKF
jgi:hypothetical protein